MLQQLIARAALYGAALSLSFPLAACSSLDDQPPLHLPATADAFLGESTTADKKLWDSIKNSGLLFEKQDRNVLQEFSDFLLAQDPYEEPRKAVRSHIMKNFGAEELLVRTSDGEALSTLLFHRPNASLNIIYVTGYFAQQTPTAEWPAPFSAIFPECNIISFDWRSFGQSSGENFSMAAKNDVAAQIAFCKTDPRLAGLPTVVVGFCIGASIALEAIIEQQEKENGMVPDAFAASCMLSDLANLNNGKRIRALAGNIAQSTFATIPFIRRHALNRYLGKPIQALKPAQSMTKLTIPCVLEYAATRDRFAPLSDGMECYEAAIHSPLKYLIVSAPGGHARLHKSTPVQYRNAY
ncbi:MAG: alpha/beta hydrolase, partial [Candidatus Dependentiae bacterium]